jgi:hypothetical protein
MISLLSKRGFTTIERAIFWHSTMLVLESCTYSDKSFSGLFIFRSQTPQYYIYLWVDFFSSKKQKDWVCLLSVARIAPGVCFKCRSHSLCVLIVENSFYPVRIRVGIDPPHPLVCRKRRLNGAVLRMRSEKPRSRVTAGVAR